jgi:hypothetical protein
MPVPAARCGRTTTRSPLFGAEVNRTGWPGPGPAFGWLATCFTGCTSLEYEIVAAGASGDLAYLGRHRADRRLGQRRPGSVCPAGGHDLPPEQGVWRTVHRHDGRYQQD